MVLYYRIVAYYVLKALRAVVFLYTGQNYIYVVINWLTQNWDIELLQYIYIGNLLGRYVPTY